MATIQLTWDAANNAVSYNVYYGTTAGLSAAHTPLLSNTPFLIFNHTGLSAGNHYYIVVGIGPNGEVGAASNEILVTI